MDTRTYFMLLVAALVTVLIGLLGAFAIETKAKRAAEARASIPRAVADVERACTKYGALPFIYKAPSVRRDALIPPPPALPFDGGCDFASPTDNK